MKFKSYRLNDGVIIIRKVNNGRWENAHLIYYFQITQKTDIEIISFERHFTLIRTSLPVIFKSFKYMAFLFIST